jgi:hypothetical protein
VPKGTKVARHVTGHRKVVPRGGTREGITQAGVERRGNKAAEDDNEDRDTVLRHDNKTRAEPKGAATRLRKTTHGDAKE